MADSQKRWEFIGKFMKELEERKKEGNAGSEDPAKDKEQAHLPREKSQPAAPENQTRLVFPAPPRGRVRHPSVRRGESPPSPRTRTRSTSPIPADYEEFGTRASSRATTPRRPWTPRAIIVAADLTNQASDCPHLPAMLEQVLANTGRHPEELSADAGYFSEANLKALGENGIEPVIPPEKVRHSQWRERTSPRGRIPRNAGPRYLMSRKLRTKRGRARYKLRQTSVEPVFGHIKEAMGFRQVPLRGRDKARSMRRLQCAAFNLMKLYRAQRAGIAPAATLI